MHRRCSIAVASAALSGGPAYADLGDQLAKLLPDDGAAFDHFGNSVAISPPRRATAIVGATGDDDNDGTVGILDLLALLANWGPCP